MRHDIINYGIVIQYTMTDNDLIHDDIMISDHDTMIQYTTDNYTIHDYNMISHNMIT